MSSSSSRSRREPIADPVLSADGRRKVYQVRSTPFAVDARFSVVKVVGYGAYGTVCSATDAWTGEKVAIKRMTNVFDDLIDGRRIVRETKVLAALDHPNILKLLTVLTPEDLDGFKDVYMATRLMDADLNQIISSRQPLIDAHARYFVAQMMRGLMYVHSAQVIHRDLKPANLLVNANCDLVVCDFGLARAVEMGNLTNYVVTRYYRAPELLLLSRQYTTAIDVWSAGCILAELVRRKPLFRGNDYLHQLHIVIEFLGSPTEDDIRTVSDDARRYIRSMKACPPRDIAEMLPDAHPEALDLLRRIFVFDPAHRASAAECLQHPYLLPQRRPDLETVAAEPFVSDVDSGELTEANLRQAFLEVFAHFRAADAEVEAQRGNKAPAP